MTAAPVQAAAATSSTTVPDAQSAPAQAANASSTPAVDAESDDTQAASKSALANDTQDDDAQAASASPTIAADSESDTAPVTAISSASAHISHEDASEDTQNDTAQSTVTSSVPATGPQIDAPKLNPKPAWQTPGNASSMTDTKTPSQDRDWQMQYPTLGESMTMRNQPKRDQRDTVDRNDTPTSERAPLEDETASHAEDAIGELQSLLQTEANSPAGRTEIASSLPASDREPGPTEPPSFSGKGYVKVDFEEHQGSKASKRAQRAEKKEEKRRYQAAQRD